MAALRLSDFDAVTFDVYGTLIDWEPSITAFFRGWADRNGLALSDEALMQAYDRIRADVQKERPVLLYPDVLHRSFERVSAEFNVPVDPGARAAFGASPHHWPPYPDSAAGLKALQLRAKVGALSNIDEQSLATSCRKLDFTFDVVVTAERVGAYKPDWPHFHTAISDLAAMGIPMQRILHVGQSLRADMVPATKLGLRCVWVNRPGRRLGLKGEGVSEARPDLIVSSLEELVATIVPSSRAVA